jgi:signal transduction histidine kinase
MVASDPKSEISELRQIVDRLSQIVKISVVLNSTLNLDRLLQFIISSAADLLECEGASILLVDDNTHELFFAAATGADPRDLKKIPVPMDSSIAGSIYRENKPIIIDEVARDPRHFNVSDKTQLEVRSLAGVPLRIRQKVTGVLEAINKRQGKFGQTDLETLSTIASHAAVAIDNARLVYALQQAYDELGKLDKVKTDFIAIASHELRTPLGLILGYATLLKEDAHAATSEHAEAVLNSAMRMQALIESMTNMNMLRVGATETVKVPQQLQPIVQSAYDGFLELINAKGQTLTLHMSPEPIQAQVDRPKLSLALTNLLNNAMRFSPTESQIWLELENHGQEVWVRVRDEGIGISTSQLERIFDQFYQAEDHLTRRHEGLGLGLAIVKAIVEAHEGRVWAESAGHGTGATFTIALPTTQ